MNIIVITIIAALSIAMVIAGFIAVYLKANTSAMFLFVIAIMLGFTGLYLEN